MTYEELFKKGKETLTKAGVDNTAFDAACLFEKCFSLDKTAILIHGTSPAPEKKIPKYLALIEKRASGRPLQYLLGEWEFLSLPVKVGEGVLIPRPETEILCETAAEWLKARGKTKVLDLCGGSGAVALGIARLYPAAQIISVELSDSALYYLNENIKLNGFNSITAVKGDVLSPTAPGLLPEGFAPVDAIVSNPPYIPTQELDTLQREVKHEPKMALDGGADGLDFYRAICRHWLKLLSKGGLVAFEIGYNQSPAVSQIMKRAGLENIRISRDYSNHPRVIAATLPE